MSFITFGEIMLRLTPVQHAAKISNSSAFGVHYAGSESNVASSLGVLGNNVTYVTKLPENSFKPIAKPLSFSPTRSIFMTTVLDQAKP